MKMIKGLVNNISMIYSDRTDVSPYGFCYSPMLVTPVERWEKKQFKVTLGLDDHDEVEPFFQHINMFHAECEDIWQTKVTNNLIYRSFSGNPYATFYQLDKGQGPVKCYDDDGHPVEPPIDGDRIQVYYTLGAWYNEKENKAGLKLYLDSVVVMIRSGTPKTEKLIHEDDCDDGEW